MLLGLAVPDGKLVFAVNNKAILLLSCNTTTVARKTHRSKSGLFRAEILMTVWPNDCGHERSIIVDKNHSGRRTL